MSSLRNRLIQLGIIFVVLLGVFYMTDYFNSHGARLQGQQAITVVLSVLLLLIGLAAIWMSFTRRADPRMQANNSRKYGLLILGLVMLVFAVVMLLQGFALG